MRALVAMLALGIAACAHVPSPEPAEEAANKASEGTVLRRATLVVHDIEASVAFYETLGFTQWYVGKVGTISEQGLPVEGASPGDPNQLIIMKGKHPYIGMIGLLQYGHKRALPEPGTMRAGDAIMMIEAEGLEEIARRIAAKGYRVHKPLEKTHIESVDSEWDASFLMVFDPDGNMVELTERHN
ncbi:VOC family protein [Altererythrobacter arenosus]|uniref:VOC family protein n=1 Tax=Altererythrobacter arenosus TaxID=3032592 RepID=A0ABY8FMS9_9SPHN|nr:VOC family protein [Altererythrobacter sp. CAU 1644]WFL76333.1 VOC family protein [Altererythrobacter sp. CAU 1644]